MGWLEARAKHLSSGAVNEQHVEDLVARRVLKGIGIPDTRLVSSEYRLFDESTPNETMWTRASRILFHLWAQHTPNLAQYWRVEAYKATGRHKDILKRMAILEDVPITVRPLPVFLTRIKQTRQSLAYIVVPPEDKGILTPPALYLANLGPFEVYIQDTEHFISQFRPYEGLYSE
jgi:hypothetical protein